MITAIHCFNIRSFDIHKYVRRSFRNLWRQSETLYQMHEPRPVQAWLAIQAFHYVTYLEVQFKAIHHDNEVGMERQMMK